MSQNESIHYSVTLADPGAHLFEVVLTIAHPDPAGQVVSMAAWIPGSYMIRDFARNVITLEASSGNIPLAVEKLDKQQWRIAPSSGTIEIRYTVYAWELSVRAAHLDTTHGYFNGTSLFLAVAGQASHPVTVDLQRPEGDPFARWRVATTLPRAGAGLWEFGRYRAADYDELVDHPVEMGSFDLIEFEAAGTPHALVLSGRHHADKERLARDLTTICEHQQRLFGELPKMERYLFLTQVTGDGYGGLEHRHSTSLICSRGDLPLPEEKGPSDGYRTFLGLCSHEYFHTWNVKRIKPAAFLPYDLSRETHTPLLWAFEGFTAYYDDLTLPRCGVISRDSYLELLGQTMTRVLRGSGRLKQSVTESSFDAWTRFYKQDENAPNAIVSYYTKGSMVALLLDLTIRLESGGAKSLDDVMRALWERHGRPLVGVTEDGIESLIEEVSGITLKPLFDRALRSTDDLPLAPLLERFGIAMRMRPSSGNGDKGGKPADSLLATTLGVRTGRGEVGVKLLNLFDGGAAQRAGLAAGDTVIAIDSLQANGDSLDGLLKPYRPDDKITIHAFRGDELLEFNVTLQPPEADTCYLTLIEACDGETAERRDSWLGGN